MRRGASYTCTCGRGGARRCRAPRSLSLYLAFEPSPSQPSPPLPATTRHTTRPHVLTSGKWWKQRTPAACTTAHAWLNTEAP